MAANPRFCVGRLGNFLTRVPASQVVVSSADANYPKAGLFDNRSNEPWKAANAAGSLEVITVDLNLNDNYGMETWSGGLPSGWLKSTSGTGTVAETTVAGEVVSGSGAKVGGGASGVAILYRDITMRAGEWATIDISIRGDGAAGTALVQVWNLQTNHYLQAGAASWGASAAVFSRSANTHLAQTAHFQVESYEACQSHTVTIRVMCAVNTNGFGYFDNMAIYPDVDVMGVFGHSIEPRSACNFNTSTDNFVGSDELQKSMTVGHPSFYGLLAARVSRRWVRLLINGPFVRIPGLAELYVSQTITLGRKPSAPRLGAHETSADRAQSRMETGSGDTYVAQRASQERRTMRVPYFASDALTRSIIVEIHKRSENGEDPMLYIPNDTKPDVLLCRVESGRSSKWTHWTGRESYHQQDLVVRELAFPQFAV